MARQVSVRQLQAMQRASKAGPNQVALGESAATGDAETSPQDVAAVDPMTGQVVDARSVADDGTEMLREIGCGGSLVETEPSAAEQLAALTLPEATAQSSRGEIVTWLRREIVGHGIPASEEDLHDEADRRWCALYPGRAVRAENGYRVYDDPGAPIEPKPEDQADEMDERLADRSDVMAGKLGRGREYDVAPDGTVHDWRRPDPGPEREPFEPEVHQVTDEDPRYSGAGTSDDVPFGSASDKIPTDAQFSGKLYRDAPELANLAERLISEHGFLSELINCEIRYFWRRKTGVSKGRVKIGYCKRASDLLGHFTGCDFIIWLSATTARDGKFTDRQVEAALFHQLLHIETDDEGNFISARHDFEGFAAEVRVYGTWTEDLKVGGQAFTTAQQMGLFDATDEDDDEDVEDDEEYEGAVIAETPGWMLAEDEDGPADPDQPYDEGQLEDLPTEEQIDAARAELANPQTAGDDPLADQDL